MSFGAGISLSPAFPAGWLGAARCSGRRDGWSSLPPPGQVHRGADVRHQLELFFPTRRVFLAFVAALLKAALSLPQPVSGAEDASPS